MKSRTYQESNYRKRCPFCKGTMVPRVVRLTVSGSWGATEELTPKEINTEHHFQATRNHHETMDIINCCMSCSYCE